MSALRSGFTEALQLLRQEDSAGSNVLCSALVENCSQAARIFGAWVVAERMECEELAPAVEFWLRATHLMLVPLI